MNKQKLSKSKILKPKNHCDKKMSSGETKGMERAKVAWTDIEFSEIELPSNRKFGFFFTFVLGLVAAFLHSSENAAQARPFIAASFVFFVITLVKNEALSPLNKLWMQFGVLLGMIVGPIVLGILFFGLFTPTAMILRISGRDELRLKFKQKESHWILRGYPTKFGSFKNQF